MYSVSSAFKAAMNDPVQEHKIIGTIGSVSFDENNIVDGSFSISNQSTDTSDVVLGSCYVGELTAEFTGVNIGWSGWIGKVITPSFGLKVGNSWEYVPLGVFKIAKATHTAFGVQITAYDNMTKFDKKFKKSHFMNLSGMYNIIDQLCTDSSVILGMSQAQIEALPNGDRTGINIYGSKGKKAEFANDITTNRDLLFWVAQTLGCFATMNRAGQLEFRKYNQNVVDVISNEHRLEGATFEDYITHYIGIYMENLDDNTEDYYGYDTTALTQELNETSGEISADQDDIEDLNADKAEWAEKLAQGQCTQAEYDEAVAEINAQIKAKQKEIKQLTKRLSWLEKALQSGGDDGSDMVLGANPLTMAKNRTTRDSQRREILGALSDISYTPFSASVVCGCIYDLGDVIQFSGGLYNSSTDSFGCVMSYTYTHNGGTELEGYGVDPAITFIRNKTQKSTDRANRNANNAKENATGIESPETSPYVSSDPKDGNYYAKTGTNTTKTSKYPVEFNRVYVCNGRAGSGIHTTPNPIAVDANGYYDFSVGGTAYGVLNDYPTDYENGSNIFKIKMNGPGTYRWSCKINADWSRANSATAWAKMGFAFNRTNYDKALNSGFFEAMPMGHNAVSAHGYAVNISDEKNTDIEYTGTFVINENDLTDDTMYMWVMFNRVVPITAGEPSGGWGTAHMTFKDFHIEKKLDGSSDFDGGVDTNVENYVGNTYVYAQDEETGTGSWQEIKRISGVDTSETAGGTVNNGLALSSDGKNELSLKPNVMRAWVKPDPPQIERTFNQFCVRYTGAPVAGVTISYHGASNWHNTSVKKSEENVYSINCGGTRTSGVDYVAYKIEGLTSGKKYYFNFSANIGNNATFTNDDTKGLGVVFNTTGVIDTNTWNGEPDTWNESTLYYSMYRRTERNYIDFSFTATASTMYMCVVVADITVGITTNIAFTDFVLSESERKYIRNFYLFDLVSNEWLQFRPFGTKDDGGATGVEYLSELNDVSFDNLQDGQILEYDESSGKWVNSDNEGGVGHYADLPDKPSINSVTLSGNKTSSDIGVVITLTQAQYDALPLADKQDANKVYYISDASGGGGGQGADVLSDLQDVQISSLSGGQILKYDAEIQKWKNVAEYSYTLPIADANTLGGVKIGSRLSIDQNGVLSANDQSYSLPIAGSNTLGGIKVGQNLSIDQDGTLNASGGGGVSDLDDLDDVNISSPSNGQVLKYNTSTQKWENQAESGGYTLPTASDSVKGGVKVGAGLDIDNNANLFVKSLIYDVQLLERNDYLNYTDSSIDVTVTMDKYIRHYDEYPSYHYVNYRDCICFVQAIEIVNCISGSSYISNDLVFAEILDAYDDGVGDMIIKIRIHNIGLSIDSGSLTGYRLDVRCAFLGNPVEVNS